MHAITQVDLNLCAVNISRIVVKFEPYVCVCDETKLMTERFFSYMAVGFLRDGEFVIIH